MHIAIYKFCLHRPSSVASLMCVPGINLAGRRLPGTAVCGIGHICRPKPDRLQLLHCVSTCVYCMQTKTIIKPKPKTWTLEALDPLIYRHGYLYRPRICSDLYTNTHWKGLSLSVYIYIVCEETNLLAICMQQHVYLASACLYSLLYSRSIISHDASRRLQRFVLLSRLGRPGARSLIQL